MKFGLRGFSSKKRISSRLTGRGTRTIKKMLIPGYGTKGVGWINNPKKASYNHIYNKTTVSADKIISETSSKNTIRQDEKNDYYIAVIFLIFFFIIILIISSNSTEKEYTSSSYTQYNSYTDKKEENKYIKDFLWKTDPRSFVEDETTKKFAEMMMWCSDEDIYNNLFSSELKKEITLEQFKEYNAGAIIEHASAIVLADNSVLIVYTIYNDSKIYSLKVKNDLIVEFNKK